MADLEQVIMDSIKDLPGREIEEGSGERPEGAIEDRTPEPEGEGAPEGSDEPTEAPDAPPEPVKKPKPTTKVEVEDEKPAEKEVKPKAKPDEKDEEPEPDEDDVETPEKQKDGRQNRLPYDRHVKIVENAQVKLFKSITGEDAPRTKDGKFDGEAATAQIKARFEEKDAEIAQHKQYKANVEPIERIMVDNPEQFLELLPHLNPAYGDLIGAAKQANAEAREADMPKADIDLGNGQFQYSIPQMEKRLQWERAQAIKEARAAAAKELEPIKKERAASEELGQRQKAVQQTLAEAREGMEGFKENEDAIFEVMRSARITAEKKGVRNTMTLDKAWVKVMLPQWKKEKQTQWEEWTAEHKGKPTATSTIASTSTKKVEPVADKSGDDPITAAIKRSIAGLKR